VIGPRIEISGGLFCCEHGNGYPGSVKRGEFIGSLRNSQEWLCSMEMVNSLFSWTVGWFFFSVFKLASIGKDKKSTGYAIRIASGLLIFYTREYFRILFWKMNTYLAS